PGTSATQPYALSLHDALPIFRTAAAVAAGIGLAVFLIWVFTSPAFAPPALRRGTPEGTGAQESRFAEPAIQRGGTLTGSIRPDEDRKSTRLNSSHVAISYAVF